MAFQIHGLDGAEFAPLFALSDEELANAGACRMIVDSTPGYPCRVSLADAEIGETVVLVNFEHQPGDSPYRSAHAIFVRENAERACPEIDAIPDMLMTRLTSIRAFDERHYLLDAAVVEGASLNEAIPTLFEDPAVAYLHLHSAARGCFTARVSRA